ncbi:hypothetical protein AN9056.2 [Aspergillus nidulans FGSC A4]|uniref:Uncharacterized protein n=1 Tax=Emericella nidulans (strain FGSC A4 / ATCC 38163 / CBS 112.46 / NRRL 194 / M139) TaxID=227321 RepID=Q5ARM4_EMENI|nr:hypothetical protein [Aspergillus nidulans FGSC A4]EAA64388.1 hypothetical protein AN9056.2 [Aspergillus nidulans FGSC A4]CBF84379.1 TPA: conserved hypothetical protein [Aspergillus nidulans FGSC A4]|eukprot:XP_682325.1 hypothetical protein AN9056.2 [Aspergillus nidulans FGSC A4]
MGLFSRDRGEPWDLGIRGLSLAVSGRTPTTIFSSGLTIYPSQCLPQDSMLDCYRDRVAAAAMALQRSRMNPRAAIFLNDSHKAVSVQIQPSAAMSSPIPVGVFFNIFALRRIRRRETTSSSTDLDSQEIPNVCYETCNGAFLEAAGRGKMAAICADGSTFSDLVDQCRQCIELFVNSPSSNSTASASSGSTTAELNEFIAYCDEQGGGSGNSNVTLVKEIDSLLASYSSLSSSQSQLQASLSSLGYTGDFPELTSATATGDVTASSTSMVGPTATAGGEDRSFSNEGGTGTEDLPSSDTSDINIIAPAVIVPVFALLVGSVLAWALIRRRRKRQGTEEIGAAGDSFDDKAQLHADEFRPELDGLAIAKKRLVNMDEDLAELPAREPIGAELDGLGRIPSNLGMYNHDRLGALIQFFNITKKPKEFIGSWDNRIVNALNPSSMLTSQEQRDPSPGQLHRIGASGNGELYSDSLAMRCSCTVVHKSVMNAQRGKGRRKLHLDLFNPTHETRQEMGWLDLSFMQCRLSALRFKYSMIL